MTPNKARKPHQKNLVISIPNDYNTILNVNKDAEQKEMDLFCIKFWWKNSTNGKPTYLIKGQQLFKTQYQNGQKPVSVFAAMISKYNEQIVNCLKMEIYDNSIYGKVTKVAVFNGIETTIHQDYRTKIFCPNTVNIGFLKTN